MDALPTIKNQERSHNCLSLNLKPRAEKFVGKEEEEQRSKIERSLCTSTGQSPTATKHNKCPID